MAKKGKITIPRIEDITTIPDLSCMHPILEDNTLICLHGGRVSLNAKNAKRMQSNGIPIMLNNEIQGASITGCLNPSILGRPSKVAIVLPYTYTQHKINKKGKVSDKEVHLYKHNGIWPKDTPKPRSPDYIRENRKIILNIKQRAMEIKNTLNIGYNSVSIETKDKLTRYDLDGKPHYEKTLKKLIDTPHKIEYTKHINPQDPTKHRMSNGAVEPISHKNLDIVENYLKRQNNEI